MSVTIPESSVHAVAALLEQRVAEAEADLARAFGEPQGEPIDSPVVAANPLMQGQVSVAETVQRDYPAVRQETAETGRQPKQDWIDRHPGSIALLGAGLYIVAGVNQVYESAKDSVRRLLSSPS